jgi:hypothetical protein
LIFHIASRNYVQDAPPPYTPPSGNWYAAPPPAYAGPAEGYGGWMPPTNVFPDQPPRKSAPKILINRRAVARSENPGGLVVLWWA